MTVVAALRFSHSLAKSAFILSLDFFVAVGRLLAILYLFFGSVGKGEALRLDYFVLQD